MAHWLKDRGLDAYAVRGGVLALLGRPAAQVAAVPERKSPWRAGVVAFRHRLFRRYSAGLFLSLTGNWVEAAAFGYVVLLLGGSAATLALIGFLNTIPNLVLGLPAGALADHFDRRKLLFVFQGANMAVAAALAVLWATGTLSVFLMGVLAVVGGSLGTLSFPAFQSILSSTVPKQDLESAVALNSLSLQLARFVGPALAGFLLAAAGPAWVFGVNAVSFLAVLSALAFLPPARATAVGATRALRRSMSEAVRYVFGQRSIAGLMVLMLFAGIFATPPVAFMLPAIVRFQLEEGARALGLLMSFMGLGSVLGSLALISLSRRANKGEPAIAAYVACAAAITAIGLSTSTELSLALAVVGGFCGVVFIGLSTVVVQATSSDEMRARAMAIWAACFIGVLPIGALITTGLAAWLGAGGAVAVDGAITLVGGLAVVVARPAVRWLGCAALPEACIAGTNPAAVALASQPDRLREATPAVGRSGLA